MARISGRFNFNASGFFRLDKFYLTIKKTEFACYALFLIIVIASEVISVIGSNAFSYGKEPGWLYPFANLLFLTFDLQQAIMFTCAKERIYDNSFFAN